MKRFFIWLAFDLAVCVGVGAYLLHFHPDTAAGKWVGGFCRQLGLADAAPAAEPEPAGGASEENAAEAAPEVPVAAPIARNELPAVARNGVAGVRAERESPVEAGREARQEAKKLKPFSRKNWYCGKRLTASDVRGRVVLVYIWDMDDAPSVATLPRIQQTWESFKHKPFTVIGSHRGERSAKVAGLLKARKITFSVYQDAYLPNEPADISSMPFLYVLNPSGKVVYRGASDVEAIEAVVNALTDAMGR